MIVAEPGREEEAALRLGRIGFDVVAGYLEGGMLAVEPRPDLVERIERITPTSLAEQLGSLEPPLLLDVRSDAEWQEQRIPGSLNIPLNHLAERASELPSDRGVVVHCSSGYRSSIGASLLRRHGVRRVVDLVGGVGGWEASGLETASRST